MFGYRRLNEIFDYIHANDYVTTQKLSHLLNISERTIRSDIQNINDVLIDHGASIILKRKMGYSIEVLDLDLYHAFLLERDKDMDYELDSSTDRLKYMLNVLLYSPDYISLDALADAVYISKNTAQTYVKPIKEILAKYNLDYINKAGIGIKIIGNENDKRQCIIDEILSHDFQNYVTGFTKEEYMLFEGINLDKIKEIVVKHLKEKEIKANDFNLKNLIIHFALMISRVMNDDYISMNAHIDVVEETKAFIHSICEDIEDYFSISITEGEKQYLYMHLIANTDINETVVSEESIKSGIKKLLECIYLNYSFDLRNDDILCKDLYNHLNSILNTRAYNITTRNPLLNTIKANFPLAYEITDTSIKEVFNNKPFLFTEDDIGYISLHIGAAIERCFSGTIAKKYVLLVCGSGQATTRMLEARLNSVFRDKILIVNKLSYNDFIAYKENDFKNIDFVISTIPLKSDYVPTITVDFALNNEDIEIITKFLATISLDKMQKSEKFFDERFFMRMKKASSKENLLRQVAQNLVSHGIVNDDFIDSVMKRESISNTNMNEVFALPHPMELCANETKVSVILLDEPLKWNNEETVKIIFLLAIKQGDQQDIEHLYDIFIEIVNNAKLQQQIIHAKDYQAFMRTLYEFID